MKRARSAGRAGEVWRIWAGTVRCVPGWLLRPSSESEVVEAVRLAGERGLTVRAAGTGHSFNSLVCTHDLLLDLSWLTGVLAIDTAGSSVTALAGTTLREVNTALDRIGLALPNLGTLADQTIAGAISTGNHGTGLGHQPLASLVSEIRLVTADGQLRGYDAETELELLRCARTALGSLGIITAVTLRCVPKFNLRVTNRSEPLAALLERVPTWAASADHVAFNWLPWSDRVAIRTCHVTDEPASLTVGRHRRARTLDEVRCGLIGIASRFGPWPTPVLAGTVTDNGTPVDYVDASHEVFCFRQPVRFLALEHALPLENLAPAMRALAGTIRRYGLYSPYSVLGRVGAADDTLLSMSYGRQTGYLNLTVPRTAGYLEMFRSAEHVLREFGARPHWGKAHTATEEILAPRYPEWERFQRTRAALDPAGMFSNDYLQRVLGPVRAAQPPAVATRV